MAFEFWDNCLEEERGIDGDGADHWWEFDPEHVAAVRLDMEAWRDYLDARPDIVNDKLADEDVLDGLTPEQQAAIRRMLKRAITAACYQVAERVCEDWHADIEADDEEAERQAVTKKLLEQ